MIRKELIRPALVQAEVTLNQPPTRDHQFRQPALRRWEILICSALLACCSCALRVADAEDALPKEEFAPQQVAPRGGAKYVLPDGTIKIVVYSGMAGAVEALDALFVQSHPGVKFKVLQGDNYSAMASLTFDITAFAPMGSEFTRIGLGDNLKIAPEPVGFRIAHGSLKPEAQLSPLAIIVNKNNPLQSLTLEQATRIFAVGGPTSDITRWSQLGSKGKLEERAIVPCGLPGSDYFLSDDPQAGEFLSSKMGGLNFNHTYQQMQHYEDVVKRVAEDPAAIGITALNRLSPEVRVVGLAAHRYDTAYSGTAEDIQAGRYSFDRYLYIYLRVNKNTGLDPFAKEYMRMVLSPEGQRAIATEAHGYIPLNRGEIAEELTRLNQ